MVVWEDVAFKAEVDRDEMAVDADRGDIIALHDSPQEEEQQVGVRMMEEGKCIVIVLHNGIMLFFNAFHHIIIHSFFFCEYVF